MYISDKYTVELSVLLTKFSLIVFVHICFGIKALSIFVLPVL